MSTIDNFPGLLGFVDAIDVMARIMSQHNPKLWDRQVFTRDIIDRWWPTFSRAYAQGKVPVEFGETAEKAFVIWCWSEIDLFERTLAAQIPQDNN